MQKFIVFTIAYIFFILLAAVISFRLEKRKYLKLGKSLTVTEFLNSYTRVTPKLVAVGLLFGVIFGMMDNLSLAFGMDGIADYIPKGLLSSNQLAGLGNIYSGVLGITFATFIELIAEYIWPDIDQDSLPVWLNGFGFVVGGFIGMFLGGFA